MTKLFIAIVSLFIVIGLLFGRFSVTGYIQSGDTLYSTSHYTCVSDILYRKGDAFTLIVDKHNKPRQCEGIVEMTFHEFRKLGG